jgi:hypothetical protein
VTDGARFEAARRLRELAIEYTERSRVVQADLVRSFEAAAAQLSAQVGDLVVESDDDESLTLTGAGRFQGSVRDDEVAEWRALEDPDDVVDFYDPVDLFDDVAGAIEDAFPELADDGGDALDVLSPGAAASPPDRPTPSIDPWLARMPAGSDAPPEGTPIESASMTILKDLHAAGVFSDEEFAARKAKLEQS